MIGALGHPLFVRVARWALGVVFLIAAIAKISDPVYFAGQVHNFRLTPVVPIPLENLVAMALPWVELLAGLAVLLNVRPRAGSILLFVLMGAFTIAVAAAWARGLDFECGCFGKAGAQSIGAKKFFENVGLTAVAAVAAFANRDRRYLA